MLLNLNEHGAMLLVLRLLGSDRMRSLNAKSAAAAPVKLSLGVFVFTATLWPQNKSIDVPLVVPAGAPLRLYLTKRVSKRIDAPIQARVLTPLFSFDREVVPAGTQVFGRVTRLEPVSRWTRVRAVLGGDFTPLHIADIEFTSLLLPDGRRIEIVTAESPGLDSLVPMKPPKHRSQPAQGNNGGLIGSAKQKLHDQIDVIKGVPDLVRGMDKRDWLYNYTMSRLPYHPQYIRNRTRFDAVLRVPLSFGSETVTAASLAMVGSQPTTGSVAHARLTTPMESDSSKPGEKVEAVLEQPLFTTDHQLLLPEGTIVHGTVGVARRARWFHRAGRLRFTFHDIELAPLAAELKRESLKGTEIKPSAAGAVDKPSLQLRTQAELTGAEGANAPVKVDSEGGAQAKESKARFIGTAAALLITHRAADNDAGQNHLGGKGQNPNVSGRTLGGGLGFGLLGSIAAQVSNGVGEGLGYYGMAWCFFLQ